MDVGTPVLQLVTSVALVFSLTVLATDRLIVRQLRKSGAISSDRATKVSVGDEAGFATYRSVRRRRALTIIGILVAAFVVAWALEVVTFQ